MTHPGPRGLVVLALLGAAATAAMAAPQVVPPGCKVVRWSIFDRVDCSERDAARAIPAQSHHQHPPQDAAVHEQFYKSWMMPDNPSVSCCDNRDCYPTEAKHDAQGWLAKRREDGKWLRVPANKVETNRDNPDGRNHLCAPVPERAALVEVFCFSVGSGM